jgi:hypothetical protein
MVHPMRSLPQCLLVALVLLGHLAVAGLAVASPPGCDSGDCADCPVGLLASASCAASCAAAPASVATSVRATVAISGEAASAPLAAGTATPGDPPLHPPPIT